MTRKKLKDHVRTRTAVTELRDGDVGYLVRNPSSASPLERRISGMVLKESIVNAILTDENGDAIADENGNLITE